MEYNEQQLREELKRRLSALGRTDVPITKTMLWEYSIDKARAEEMAETLNSEMVRANFARILGDLFAQDEETRREVMNSVRSSSFSMEDYFQRGGMPETCFYATPPIESPRHSDRILITGTKAEIGSLYREVEELKSGKPSRMLNKFTEEIRDNPINYCATVGSFWRYFFDQKDFLDYEVSVPKKIIGTGALRNYNMYGGETMDVKERLKEVAEKFKVPIAFIRPFHI